jgi:hypothetical protein
MPRWKEWEVLHAVNRGGQVAGRGAAEGHATAGIEDATAGELREGAWRHDCALDLDHLAAFSLSVMRRSRSCTRASTGADGFLYSSIASPHTGAIAMRMSKGGGGDR